MVRGPQFEKRWVTRTFLSDTNNAATPKAHTILAEAASKPADQTLATVKGSDIVEQQRTQVKRLCEGGDVNWYCCSVVGYGRYIIVVREEDKIMPIFEYILN